MVPNTLLWLVGTGALLCESVTGHFHQPRVYEYGAPVKRAVANSAVPQSVLTIITPSPHASPITVTEQYQVVNSFVPKITLCAMALVPKSTVTAPYQLTNTTVNPSRASIVPVLNDTIPRSPSLRGLTPTRSVSLSTIYSLSEGCKTTYSPTHTTVCHTTLTGLASKVTVSKCNQMITFSKETGYRLSVLDSGTSSVPSSLQPQVQTVTTFWAAPWQALTAGLTPANVTEKICSVPATAGAGQVCVDTAQSWSTYTATSMTVSTTDIDLTTTITGPQRVIVETYHADITETETVFSLSTRMILIVSTESLATETSNLPNGLRTASMTTQTTTKTVYPGSKATSVLVTP